MIFLLETKISPRTDLRLVITGLAGTETTYFRQVEKDSFDVNEIVQHVGLLVEWNLTDIRRLGKNANRKNKENTVTDRILAKQNSEASTTACFGGCSPLLVTVSKSYFIENCFAHTHYLQNYKYPTYIKKFFSSTDRQFERRRYCG